MASSAEEMLARQIELNKLPAPMREWRFHPKRRWRFDFGWLQFRLAVECEGGTWSGGRHVRGKGYEADLEKYNAAALLDWLVLRFTPAQVRSGVALSLIQEAIKLRSYIRT